MKTITVKETVLKKSPFFCSAPMLQSNLMPSVKILEEIIYPTPLNKYDSRPHKTFCYACGKINHFRGLTIECEKGKALIGNCCAEGFFGENYATIVQNMENLQDAFYYENYLLNAESVCDVILAHCDLRALSAKQMDLNTKIFSQDYPDLYARIQISIKEYGSTLVHLRQIANPLFVEGHNASRYTTISESVGSLPLAEAFTLKHNNGYYLQLCEISSRAKLVKKELGCKPERLNELKRLARILGEAKSGVLALDSTLQKCAESWSSDSLALISKWNSLVMNSNANVISQKRCRLNLKFKFIAALVAEDIHDFYLPEM